MIRALSLAILFLISLAHTANASGPWTGTCVAVADGDTITVAREQDGRSERVKVRLYGVDCPEGKQAYGPEAREFATSLALGKSVEIEPAGSAVDRYGRVIAWVKVGGSCLNDELVRAGMAWWYVRYAPRERRLMDLQTSARTYRVGLWSQENPIAPWSYRKKR